MNELEEAIRERLVRSSSDVPDVAAMRERVLAAIESEASVGVTPVAAFRARSRRTAGVLVGVAGAVAVLGVMLAQQAPNTLVTADEPSIERVETAVDRAAPRLGFSDVRDALAASQPTEEAGTWSIQAEAKHVLTLAFVPTEDEPDGAAGQYLRIVTLPPEATADDVADSITSSLFDTVVVGDTISQIGGLDSRVLRLETVAGTTRLGFKVADGTYLETEGIDRSFVVHITGSTPDTVVYWIEAGPQQIDELEDLASRFIESVNER